MKLSNQMSFMSLVRVIFMNFNLIFVLKHISYYHLYRRFVFLERTDERKVYQILSTLTYSNYFGHIE